MTDRSAPRHHPDWFETAAWTANFYVHVIVSNNNQRQISADLRIYIPELPDVGDTFAYYEQFVGAVTMRVDEIREHDGASPGFAARPNWTIYASIVE